MPIFFSCRTEINKYGWFVQVDLLNILYGFVLGTYTDSRFFHYLGNCEGDDILFWALSFLMMPCAKAASTKTKQTIKSSWCYHMRIVSFIMQGWGRNRTSQTNLTMLASQLGFLEVLIIPGNCKRSPAPGAIWASEKSLRTSFLIWNQSGLHLLQEQSEQELMAVPGSSWVGLQDSLIREEGALGLVASSITDGV